MVILNHMYPPDKNNCGRMARAVSVHGWILMLTLFLQTKLVYSIASLEVEGNGGCTTEVDQMMQLQYWDEQLMISMRTNDWKLINGGHENSMDASNTTDCFPVMVPVLMKKCFLGCGAYEWTKTYPT